MSTPHARGSTFIATIPSYPGKVYPACAGIHLRCEGKHFGRVRLPRMRGDPPKTHRRYAYHRESTPHARGSTSKTENGRKEKWVYPACAGIHPKGVSEMRYDHSLPRMRGDPPRFDRFIG